MERCLEIFEIWYLKEMEKCKWSDRITNEDVLGPVDEKRSNLIAVIKEKANWSCHIFEKKQTADGCRRRK